MSEPIAIVGIACRFPGGANDPNAFWQLMIEGRDAIEPITRGGIEPERYFDPTPRTPGRMMTRWGGLLEDLDRFDAGFFGISPRESASLDPAQRLLLEAAWEAFEDAAIDPTTQAGTPVGVFVGQWLSDFENRLYTDPDQVDFHATTGSGRYASSGRLSFLLGAVGPSITVDTACSSSLVAVHLACQSLRTGESSLAIAAGVNVILQPHISIAYSQSEMMAPDGRCKFGDAKADGYVRSEGAGVVLLKPLAAALAAGDGVRAVIRGSAVNNDGRGSGHLTTPSRTGQAAMLRAAYAAAQVSPALVGYVEAHGTGTRAGDPVELGALGDVLRPGRGPDQRCMIGSVKTNVGHTEGAAGIAGLIKCVLALEHEIVPPSLHLGEPSPAIPWDELPFDIPQNAVPWPRGVDGRRLAGVSAFGITGTNAHIVIEEAPSSDAGNTIPPPAAVPLVLSAASPPALRALAAAYADLLADPAAPPLADVCATAARHRAALEHRAVFVADDPGSVVERLRLFAAGDEQAADANADAGNAPPRRIAFAFPGQGGQWTGMARELLEHEPAFRSAIERCDDALPRGLGWTVRGQLDADSGTDGYRMDEISVIQPVLLAVEIALAELWRTWGVVPEAVVGHSMGEVAAAHLAGVLSLEEAMKVICARSALMQRTSGAGAMAVVELSLEDAQARIEPYRGRVCVAVTNGPHSTVVSGDADAVAEIVSRCKRDEIFARSVKVDVASHSTHMDPLIPELVATLHDLAPQAASTGLYSTVDAAARPGTTWDACYWGRNLRETVRFGPAVEAMLATGIDAFVEVGPHPTLLTSIAEAGGGATAPPVTLGSLRRRTPEQATMLGSLGALWAVGHPVDWSLLFPSGSYARVALPHYPWQRERHWADAALPLPPDGGVRRRRPLDETVTEWIHVPRWEPTPLGEAGSAAGTTWLLVGGPADPLQRLLEERGASVERASTIADAARRMAAAPADLGRLEVVFLPGASDRAYEPVAVVRAIQEQRLDTAPVATPRLWWVTAGAHAVAGLPPAPGAADEAALWGAARVVAVEHPQWWGGLVDIDPTASGPSPWGALVDHLSASPDEDQVAIRDGQRYALRLVPADLSQASGFSWRPDASYLVTGGLGGVARKITAAMVRDGARRLVLLGRTPLPPRVEWSGLDPDSEVGRRVAAVRDLEHAGASVHLLTADVADEAQVRAVIEEYASEGWPPIAGAIHAAGVIDSRLTIDMDPEIFATVVAPKLGGALVLDRVLPELDLFVVFSSISAFWAPEGMANYAAANAGLDAVVQSRRARGQHALGIQWGPWSEVGLHERTISARSTEDMASEGVTGFTPEQGTALFGALVSGDEPVVTVLPIDWSTFRRAARARYAPLFRSAPGADAAVVSSDVVDRLREASPADRVALLEQVVRGAAGRVLRTPAAKLDARRPFGSLGLDSLMALELRKHLETTLAVPLPATLAWNYPTVEALTAHLDSVVVPADLITTASAVAATAVHDEPDLDRLIADVDALSDDDAVDLLKGART